MWNDDFKSFINVNNLSTTNYIEPHVNFKNLFHCHTPQNLIRPATVCLKSLCHICIVGSYLKIYKTSWTYGVNPYKRFLK